MSLKSVLLTAVCALSLGACNESTPITEEDKLGQLFKDEWSNRLQENPTFATSHGVSDYNDRLQGISAADHARRLGQDKRFLARLDAIPRDTLNVEEQLNADLFRFVMDNRVKSAAFEPWRIPFLSDSGFHTWIVRIAESMPFKTVEDYDNYIARLNAIPAYFAQQTANMKQGLEDGFSMPRLILDNVEPSFAAQIVDDASESAFYKPFAAIPEHFSAADRARIEEQGKAAVDEAVVPAYRDLHAFFKNDYMPNTRKTIGAKYLPDGDNYYRYLVKYYTTLDVTPEEVHETGLREVARIRQEMEAVMEKVEFDGNFLQFLRFMRTDKRFYVDTPEQLLKEASFIAKKIDGQLPAFFNKLPRMPYGVRAVPDDIAPNYTTGRYWGAPKGGKRGGLYMVNTYALDKRPLYNLPALTLHEGVPGHHLQNALAAELENVPEFRKSLYPHAFGEGWGLYSETLGKDMGLYDDPYAEFGRLTYEMWRAGRLVVDTGMHYMDWSRRDAFVLFMRNSALSFHNIDTEVDRYISWPGQALAYKMGELKIHELRKYANDELGTDFDVRDFHDAVLANGGVTLPILDAKIRDFVEAKKAEQK